MMKAVILAAGIGKRLRDHTDDPKCLLKIGGRSLLCRYLSALGLRGVSKITVVAGYKYEKVADEIKAAGFKDKVELLFNPNFTEGSILSLWCAKDELDADVMIMDADVYFEDTVINRVCTSTKKDFFLLDTTSANDGEAVMVGFDGEKAVALARGLQGSFGVKGEMVGFTKFSGTTVELLVSLMKRKIVDGERNIGYEFLFPEMFDACPISYELVDGLKWVEIDFPADVRKAEAFAASDENS